MSSDSPQIVAIRARYKASFSEKKQLIDEYVERLSDEPTDKLVLSELHGELHKLAGSSGMYGYDDISRLCREIMQEIVNDCCLLYTSPSPRDKRQSRMPSSA